MAQPEAKPPSHETTFVQPFPGGRGAQLNLRAGRAQDTAFLSGGGEDLEGERRVVAPVVSLKVGEVVADRCSCRVEIAIAGAEERQLAVIDDRVWIHRDGPFVGCLPIADHPAAARMLVV